MMLKNNFITGFLSAVLLILGCLWYAYGYFRGGCGKESPSGQYSLSIAGPLVPSSTGGTYEIDLREFKTGLVLREYTVKLSSRESLKCPRDGSVVITWDTAEEFADITVDSEFLIRVAVPKPQVILDQTVNPSELSKEPSPKEKKATKPLE